MVPDHSLVRWLSRIGDLRNHISHENVTRPLFFNILTVPATPGAETQANLSKMMLKCDSGLVLTQFCSQYIDS